jgi:ParB-like chromosome segregation protein Spo0J
VLRYGGHVVLPEGAVTTVRTVPVCDIRLPDNSVRMDDAHVVMLAGLVVAGEWFSPVLLSVAGDGTYWLIEGRHRFLATLLLGRDEILAVVTNRLDLRPAG